MKRLLLLALALVAFCSVQAQRPVYVYGVDFAQTKVFGASESISDFTTAFVGINNLLYGEAEKYDFSKVLGTTNFELHHEVMIDRIQQSDFSNLRARGQAVPVLNVPQIIASYRLPHTEGVGFVLIARLLNKTEDRGSYYAVLFDVATRKVLLQTEITTKSRGFGLRNFWAFTVYNATKQLRMVVPSNY